jgi:hypothetical protein
MKHNALKKRKGRFLGIPYSVVNSAPFAELRAPEVKLLVDLLLQYNGRNNGTLSPCHTLMEKRGWAKSSLHRAFSNLQHLGFLVVTRQGWKRRGKATFVAITWLEINEPQNGIEYDDGIASSNKPLSYWCTAMKSWKHKPKIKEIKKFLSPNMESKNASYSPKLELIAGGKVI